MRLAFWLLAVAALAQDPNELLKRGTTLITTSPAEAVRTLEQALRLNPDLPTLRYQLGLAYHAIGDEADAAAQWREALARDPDSAATHNYLGIALFQMGDAKGALEEFRVAAKLAPKDPNAHFNFGEALARTGDSQAAVEQLRIAVSLSPGDAPLARLLDHVETKLRAPQGAIRVDVRQVLVPVVVSDSKGHHLSGLKQADFRVFEDGVEQKITAFSVETSGELDTTAGSPQPEPARAAPAGSPARNIAALPAPRRTYLILVDTLHTTFSHFENVRDALVQLFRREQSADTQYVVVSLGVSPEMLVNVTRDASAVLAALQSKRMQKVWLEGQTGGIQPEMDRFRRDLNDTRNACDLAASDRLMAAKCNAGLTRAVAESNHIAELDRATTTGFLQQFRSLVAQLARARDRRTIILISDGFEIEPGHEAFALRDAYFPFTRHCLVPASVYCPPSDTLSATRMNSEFEPILKLAAAGNITIDTIDSRGLSVEPGYDVSTEYTSPLVDGAVSSTERDNASARGNTLAEIASATGGTAFHDNNDFLAGLERAFADGRDYYTLAYVSSNTSEDGKFRAISVQVRDREAVVNAKRGYWAPLAAQ